TPRLVRRWRELVVVNAFHFYATHLQDWQHRVDHRRRPAGVSVRARVESIFGEALLQHLIDEPGLAGPTVVRLAVRQGRNELEVADLGADGGDLVEHKKIGLGTRPVEEPHWALLAA